MEKKKFKLGPECYEFFGNYSEVCVQILLNIFFPMTEEQKIEWLNSTKAESLKVGKDLVEFLIGKQHLPVTVELNGYEVTIEA